ncbi:MAG: 30S ribosomal protein S17 [Candidatus Pacearchaeota archaeon]|nr:30S ribosomal protein S17 [Candidatus Pacearchaeota archaeon]
MKKTEKKSKEEKEIVTTICNDKRCHIHGGLKTRGRIFEGRVIKKFPKRIVIEFERMIYNKKYERYSKSRTKIHARLPICIENDIQIGDLIMIQECRPLSKIIHFVVIKKIKSAGER